MTDAAGRAAVLTAHDEYIERRRLDHFFARASGKLVRVLAPSGYGKTTLVQRWVADERRAVRWVDLSRRHDDPVALFGALREALVGLADVRLPTAEHAVAANPYVRALEEGVSRADPSEPFVLVLDDVHRVRHETGQWLIRAVVDRMPSGSTVVVIGRGHDDHGIVARLRITPGVVDLGVDDLAFEMSESCRLFDALGVDSRSPYVADLVTQLEGWPAGVRLAASVLRSDPEAGVAVDHVSLVDYLSSEWLGQLPADEFGFLSEVACLDRFTAAMCDEVLDRTGSGPLIDRLHRDSVLVFELEQRNDEYRLHGLLRRWLSSELRRADPVRWATIHSRAATYRERNGDIEGAAEHLISSGNLDELEWLAMEHGGQFFTSGLDATVERWLAVFPPERLRTSPGLCGLQSIKALHAGDDALAVQWLRVLDETLRRWDGPDADPTILWSNVLHAALDEKPAAELLGVIAPASERLVDGPWSGFAHWVEGALCFLVGDVDTARRRLETGATEGEIVGSPLVVSHCRATLAIIADCRGDRREAQLQDSRAQEAVTACGGELLAPAAVTMASSALQCARRGDHDAAARRLAVAHRSLAGFRSTAPWFNTVARLALARTALLLGDRETAATVVRELEHHLAVEPSSSEPNIGARGCLLALRSDLDGMDVPATGVAALTDAERRVLRLLPTNMSLEDIAAQLYVSRNTVKTHVASIYRKTGATKRVEAVELARMTQPLPDASPG